MWAVRLSALAVYLVCGEVDQVTQQVGTCFFLEFATREFLQRFAGLSGPAQQKSPALNAAPDYDPRFIRHGNQVEPGDKMLGWYDRQTGGSGFRIVHIRLCEEPRKTRRPSA